MSHRNFHIRHNVPQIGLQNTLQGTKAFGLRVSPMNVVPMSTKADNATQRRTIEDHADPNSKPPIDTHNKKIVVPARKPLHSRVNLILDKKKEGQSTEKLPKSAPNNLNARTYLKQGVRPPVLKGAEEKNRRRNTENKRSEDQDTESERRMTEVDGSSTHRGKNSEQIQDDGLTEITSSDGQTIIQEGLRMRINSEGLEQKYNRKYRVSSRGLDNVSDQIEEDIVQDRMSRDGQAGVEGKGKEEESNEERSWQKKSMDFTLSQLTPDKNKKEREIEGEEKERAKNAMKSRRKDSILTNTSNNSTRPDSEMQSSHAAQTGVMRVRGTFTKEHIPLSDIRKQQEQKKVFKECLDLQLEEKNRLREEEKARKIEEQRKEEERIKKENETLSNRNETDANSQTFGRKRVVPPKKESISVQQTASKRIAPRKNTEEDVYRISEGEGASRGQIRTSSEAYEEGYLEPFNLDVDNFEDFNAGGTYKLDNLRLGGTEKIKGNVDELVKQNDYLWEENQKKGELIDILIRALKNTDKPVNSLNPLLSPPSRKLHTEISPGPESNRHFSLRPHNPGPKQSFAPYETQLLDHYFTQDFPNNDLMKTQHMSNRRTRPYEAQIPGDMGEDRQGYGLGKQGINPRPHKPPMQLPLQKEIHGYPVKDLASPLRSPTLTNQIFQQIPAAPMPKMASNNNLYSHSRVLTSPDEVAGLRAPLAQIQLQDNGSNNINYGVSGSTRRAEQGYMQAKMNYGKQFEGIIPTSTKGFGNIGSQENIRVNPGVVKSELYENPRAMRLDGHQTFSGLNGKLANSNILVEEGFNFPKQEGRQIDEHEEHVLILPSLQGKRLQKPIQSSENIDMESRGLQGLKALVPEFGKGKSNGALDQTARFPKEIFAVNMKKKH